MSAKTGNTRLELTPGTKILDLLQTYPFLVDTLGGLSPHFKALKSPVMRNTLGRVATLQRAATMGGVSLEELMETIARAVLEHTGETLEVAAPAGEPAEAGGGEEGAGKLETLKGIILSLHAGEDPEAAKARFAELVRDTTPVEIAEMEQQLIGEGLPAEEVKRLCDVHTQLFRESLDTQVRPDLKPGHPVHTMLAENVEIQKVIDHIRGLLGEGDGTPDPVRHGEAWGAITEALDRLAEINKHYLRKENQLFPVLEKKGFTGPSQVMWAIHDDVRALLKRTKAALEEGNGQALGEVLPELLQVVADMIYKEEHILIPTALDLLEHEDWARIRKGEEEIGFALVEPGGEWSPRIKINYPAAAPAAGDAGGAPRPAATPPVPPPAPPAPEPPGVRPGRIPLDTGELTFEQVNLVLTHLPVEISFVDENDEVKYYTGVEEKIFPRSPGVIGRKVQNCHPPKSVHLVNRILADFRAGRRDVAEFWMDDFQGRFIHIRYFAVRDRAGRYRGTLEAVQDVTAIRKLEGEKRLLDEESGG